MEGDVNPGTVTVPKLPEGILVVWVVFERPSDFPNKFVVRRQGATKTGVIAEAAPFAVVDTLEEAREAVPRHLFRLDRHPEDVPCLVETWI